MATNPTLSFLRFEVIKIAFDKGEFNAERTTGDFKVKVMFRCDVNEDNKNDFLSSFILSLTHKEDPSFNFQMEAFGKFLINGEIESGVYENYTTISAPSIVYPYIRAFISTLFIQAGLKQFFIPPINFILFSIILPEVILPDFVP